MKYPDIRLGDVEAVWNILGGQEGVNLLKNGRVRVEKKKDYYLSKNFLIHANNNPEKVRGHFKEATHGGCYSSFDFKGGRLQSWFLLDNEKGLVHKQCVIYQHVFSGYWELNECLDKVKISARKDAFLISEVYSIACTIMNFDKNRTHAGIHLFMVRNKYGEVCGMSMSKLSEGWRINAFSFERMEREIDGSFKDKMSIYTRA